MLSNKCRDDSAAPGSDLDLESEDNHTHMSPERSMYKTQSVCFKDTSSTKSHPMEEDDLVALFTKMKGVLIHEPSYMLLYMQCQKNFPHMVQHLPKPDLYSLEQASTSATVAYQSPPAHAPPCQSWEWRMPTPFSSLAAPDTDRNSFFGDRNGMQPRSCASVEQWDTSSVYSP